MFTTASMGPRSDERGNSKIRDGNSVNNISLQWGRAPMSAEIDESVDGHPRRAGFNGAALR